jgi:diguanylate cyclase (GGDEF)-like protein/PAS domain S-box-containing protein
MEKPRILIVEDEYIVAMDMQKYLERNGYQLAGHVDRGEDAVQQIAELHPDLVLMDISLKGEMDGIEAATHIWASYKLPVVFLTAYANQTTIERARIAEPYGYLLKPFDERELIAAIEMALYKNSMETRLRESEVKFRSVVENASDGIAMIDTHGRVTEWNAAMEDISGLTRAEVIDRPIWEITFQMLPKELKSEQAELFSRDVWQRSIEADYVNIDPMTERDIETPEGIHKTIQSNGFKISTSQGMMGGVIIRDVTERKRAEELLVKNEKRLRVITQNAPSIITELDLEGHILFMSRVLPGYSMDDVLGKHVENWISEKYRPVMQQALDRVIAEGTPQSYESAGAGAHGEMRWYLTNLSPVIENDRVEKIILVATDITERKQIDSELRKLSRAVEQSANSIVVTDPEGRIEYVNPRFTQVSGYAFEDLAGKTPRILCSGEHPSEYYQILWQTIKSGRIWRGEFHNRRKDGSLYWEDTTITPVHDPDGTLTNFIAIKEDITLRKMLEEQERDQHLLAESLRDTAITLNTSLKLDDVLDVILGNIGKLVPYDAAMVSIIDGDTIRKIRYSSNPHIKTHRLSIGNMQANLLNVPILKTLIQSKRPFLVPDLQADDRWQVVAIPDMQRIRSMLCAPIEIEENVAGIINLVSGTPDFFTEIHSERIVAFANQAAVAIKNAQLYEHAQRLSVTDPLTGLFNMRYFRDFAGLEFERVKRYARTLSVAMVDVDHFKSINDRFGHAVGDRALHEIAMRIKTSIRSVDVVARYGGEEFVFIMPETPLDEAMMVAERVRQNVAETHVESNDAVFSVTLSIGVAELKKEMKDLDELIRLADKSLYAAKAKGRNRVEG